MPYPITEISGIVDGVAQRLRDSGIRTTVRLLDQASSPKGRRQLAEKAGVDAKQILCWANKADRMRIKGVGDDYAELLQQAGVNTVRELAYRNPARLAAGMAAANAQRKLVQLVPTESQVARWIDEAKKLPIIIKYR